MPNRPAPLSPDEQRDLWGTGSFAGFWPEGQDIDRDYDFADIARLIAGIGFPRVPVGPPIDRRDIQLPPSGSIPTLVSNDSGQELYVGPIQFPTPGRIFKEDIGRRIPQITEVLPVQTKIKVPVIPQVRTGPSTKVGGPESTKIYTGEAKMPDLGSLFEGHFGLPGWEGLADLGAGILGYGSAAPPTFVPNQDPPAPAPMGGAGSIFDGTDGASCETDPRNQYVLKFICGQWKWVKKRKRRSKRLATASDIKDLSSLMGVLGSGKNLTTWIATHR